MFEAMRPPKMQVLMQLRLFLLPLLVLLLLQHQQHQLGPKTEGSWGPLPASAFISRAPRLSGSIFSRGLPESWRGPPSGWGPVTGAPWAPLPVRGAPLQALLCSPAQEKLALSVDGKERSGEYVIVEIGGFQRWMERGRFYDVNRLKQKEGGRVLLLRVLMLQQRQGPTLLGQPFLEHIRVGPSLNMAS